MCYDLYKIEKILEEIRQESESTYYFEPEKLEKLRTIMILEKANFDNKITDMYINLLKEFNLDKEFSINRQYLNSILLMFTLNKADYIANRKNKKEDLIWMTSSIIFILNRLFGDNLSSQVLSEYIGLISGLVSIATILLALATTLNKLNYEVNVKPIEEKLNLNLSEIEEEQVKKYKELFNQILDFIYLEYNNKYINNNIKIKRKV